MNNKKVAAAVLGLMVGCSVVIASTPSEAGAYTYGSCTFSHDNNTISKTSTVHSVSCNTNSVVRVRARVYWYNSSNGATEYSTVGAWAGNQGTSTAGVPSGKYWSRGYWEGN